jgi:hypothetical protein
VLLYGIVVSVLIQYVHDEPALRSQKLAVLSQSIGFEKRNARAAIPTRCTIASNTVASLQLPVILLDRAGPPLFWRDVFTHGEKENPVGAAIRRCQKGGMSLAWRIRH